MIRWDIAPVTENALVRRACWVSSPNRDFVLAYLSWDKWASRIDYLGQIVTWDGLCRRRYVLARVPRWGSAPG
jgi:hypothetical protein